MPQIVLTEPGSQRAPLSRASGPGNTRQLPATPGLALADPANHIITVEDRGDWTTREVAAQIPAATGTIVFGVFLAGPGQVQLRDPQLTRAGLAY
jgi:hypothetical protein